MATNTLPRPRSEKKSVANIALWALQILIALFLIRVGVPKLLGDPVMVQTFGAIGAGQWFRYLTGTLEVAGSIGLLIPGITGYAAIVLAAVMTGAVVTHLVILGGSPVIALVLLAALLTIAWVRLGNRI